MQRVVNSYGPIPENPDEQTALWYRIHRGHKDDVSVEDAHGAYLKFHEMATLSIVLIILSGCLAAYFGIGRRQLFLGALLLIIIEYLIVMSAARNAATRLVSNVLAIESAATSHINQ